MDALIGRALWFELHSKAGELKVDLGQISFMADWSARAEAALGCRSCWWKVERFCKLWPIAYGADFYLWSICLHDYVNKELGRPFFFPELTLAPMTAKGIIQ